MNKDPIKRRTFLHTLSTGLAGTVTGSMMSRSAQAFVPVKITEPFHGAILNRNHGKETDTGLQIQISGRASLRDHVIVNGTRARREGERFLSELTLKNRETEINNAPIETVEPTLSALANDPNQSEIMDLFTHEQYFWPFYKNYIPDHADRLDTAIRWVSENGYKPVFYHEGFLGID